MSEAAYPLWDADANPALLASRDRDSGEIVFPALPATSPLLDRHENVRVAGTGRVYSYTVIHPAPKTGEAPYPLGFVDFPGPVRIFGRLQGKDRPVIGDRYTPRPNADFGYVFEAVAA